jgi:hypothetical protein
MAHWAKINESGIVTHVTVGNNSDFDEGYSWLVNNLGGTWIKTSYNTYGGSHKNNGIPLRKNFAAIGMIYDPIRDAFYEQQPYNSWILNEETCLWEPPTSCPNDGSMYEWNEESLSWIVVE